jgi:hypothetical protein
MLNQSDSRAGEKSVTAAWLMFTVILLLVLAAPPDADTQQPTRVPRIGTLFTPFPEDPEARLYDVFSQALREAK